jgi:AhpD family alkylhydroperoxidase
MKTDRTAVLAVMGGVRAFEEGCRVDKRVRELVKIRASQINGCAYCLNMHVNDARTAGESDERLHLVAVWREAPVFSARERAALAWTEAVTLIGQGPVPDAAYEAARAQFADVELVHLTLVVAEINAWNRIMAAFEVPPQLSGGA